MVLNMCVGLSFIEVVVGPVELNATAFCCPLGSAFFCTTNSQHIIHRIVGLNIP